MDKKYIVSPSPHLHAPVSTTSIMRDVIIALCPAILVSVLAYGWADSINVLRNGKKVFSGVSEDFYSDAENVHLCGLLPPSTFDMNREISAMRGISPAPYPRSSCEFLAKFGDKCTAGRIFCVPYKEGAGLSENHAEAVREAGPDTRIGVYGPDSRNAIDGERIDFYFNGIDSCFSEAVLGRDSVIIYDEIFEATIREKAESLRALGADIRLEAVK